MRVAIIERSKDTQAKIKKRLKGHNRKPSLGNKPLWEIDYYIDPEKFLNEKETTSNYDIVLVDCDLGDKVCFDFIHRVSNKTDAELCIITGASDSDVLGNLLQDESINHILDKDDLSTIVDHLEYTSARNRIKDHLMNESAVYATITNEMF